MKKDTKPVAEAVRLCLESTPFIESMLSDGTANYSAIARKIRGDVEAIAKAKANEESILMAVLQATSGLGTK